MAAAPDVLTLEVPDDPRYLDVAIATVEALAVRAGLDKDELASLRTAVQHALAERLSHRPSGRPIVLRYEVGVGFLGVRLVDEIDTRRGATS
jgi:anti-sigma regulatory factor (Ser/Thr protein kinase)